MRWYLRCAINTAKAAVPFHDSIRHLKYRLRAYPEDRASARVTIGQGLLQIDRIACGLPLSGARVLEIGSGWQPIIPLLFSAAGASVTMCDLNRLCTPASLEATLRVLRRERDAIAASPHVAPQRLDALLASEPAFSSLGLSYLAPCDLRSATFASPFDAVISRAVLEHVPPAVVRELFAAGTRILRDGGVACHIIDNSDHWEHRDKRISRINFLKFSERVFRMTCFNRLDYQNRLRHPEYVEALRASGMTIVCDERTIDQKALSALTQMRLAPRFRHFSPEDLATVTSLFLAQKRVNRGA